MIPLTELYRISIKNLFETTPFEVADIEKAYAVFDHEFTFQFLTRIRAIGVTVDFALEKIRECHESWNVRPDWHELPPVQKSAYVEGSLNWLANLMDDATDLADQC